MHYYGTRRLLECGQPTINCPFLSYQSKCGQSLFKVQISWKIQKIIAYTFSDGDHEHFKVPFQQVPFLNEVLQGVSYWFVPNQLALFLSKINNLVINGVFTCCLHAEIWLITFRIDFCTHRVTSTASNRKGDKFNTVLKYQATCQYPNYYLIVDSW